MTKPSLSIYGVPFLGVGGTPIPLEHALTQAVRGPACGLSLAEGISLETRVSATFMPYSFARASSSFTTKRWRGFNPHGENWPIFSAIILAICGIESSQDGVDVSRNSQLNSGGGLECSLDAIGLGNNPPEGRTLVILVGESVQIGSFAGYHIQIGVGHGYRWIGRGAKDTLSVKAVEYGIGILSIAIHKLGARTKRG